MATTKEDAATRTILLELNGSGKKMRVSNIPANAKVTFSNMIPKGDGRYGAPSGDRCLRIYTSENNQLGVFVGVKWFRDESLKVETQMVTEVKSETVDKNTGELRTHKEDESTKIEWVDEGF